MADDVWSRSLVRRGGAQPWRVHIDNVRFLVFGRSLPAVLFGVLAYRVGLGVVAHGGGVAAHPSALGVLGLLPSTLYLLFCAIPVAVYIARPRARARDGRLVARAAALTGTTMLLVVGVLGGPVLFAPPAPLQVLATLLTLLAFSAAVCGLLSLRRSLSIIPEARRLVSRGPYRLVRHPLYAAEILAAVAMILSRPALWAVLSLAPFVGVQLLRAHFEERLLRRTFPQYAAYAQRTSRLVPGLW